jgi:isoleucyl-tRNA synthetase
MTDTLVERLEASRIVLKSGDYDGADLMRAWCAMMDAVDALKAQANQIAEKDEALREIENLPGEINPSNYDHDDVCELNRQFCYAVTIARKALSHSSETSK